MQAYDVTLKRILTQPNSALLTALTGRSSIRWLNVLTLPEIRRAFCTTARYPSIESKPGARFPLRRNEKEYANTLYDLMTSLAPEGILEQCFAIEIMKATWRLRRRRNVEFDLAEAAELDPMIDERTSVTQKTVDRARTQSHSLLRRSLSELCKLQLIRLRAEAAEIPKPKAANGSDMSDALATFSALAVNNSASNTANRV